MTRQPVNIAFNLVLAADNTPTPCVAFLVPPGTTVRVRAHNGKDEGNLKPIRVATNAPDALTGPYELLGPNNEIQFPVNNTGNIYICGAKDDGAVITIKG
jgi:hypothetical protein